MHQHQVKNVDIADLSIVIGAPMVLTDLNREINLITTQSGDVYLDGICGKSYIYNLHNFRDEFHVGNVFYRDGKLVLMM